MRTGKVRGMFRRGMKQRSLVVLAIPLIVVFLSASGCIGDGGDGNSNGGGGNAGSGGGTAIGPYQSVYDQNGCQVFRGHNLPDVRGVYCAKKVGEVTYDFYYQGSGGVAVGNAVFQQEYNPANAAYDVRFYYPNGPWTRSPLNSPTNMDFCWRADTSQACQWVSLAQYQANIQQQQQNSQAAAQQQQAAQHAAAEQEAQLEKGREQLAQFKEREIEIGEIWTRPACDSSYNGCL